MAEQKQIKDVKYVAVVIYNEEYKEAELKGSMTRKEASAKIRDKLGLKPRTSTRGTNSISGIMKGKDYTDEEKDEIKNFVKKLGTDKATE